VSVETSVVLIPVAVSRVPGSDVPYLMGLRSANHAVWASAAMRADPRQVATDLLSGILEDADLEGLAELLDINSSSLQPVEFVDRAKKLVLIYTLALPTGWTELAALSDRWVRLCETKRTRDAALQLGRMQIADEASAPYAEHILDHWRQLLEETPAVLSFLAPYFTLPQARDVYSAVWGYEQDATHWGTWANKGGNLADVYEAINTAEVSEGFRGLLEEPQWQELSGMTAATSAPLIEGPQENRWTGISRVALGTVAASLIPGAALGALTSGVAHQVVKPRGKPPQWHKARLTRADLYDLSGMPRQRLESVYSPRPTWQSAGSIAPSNRKSGSGTYKKAPRR